MKEDQYDVKKTEEDIDLRKPVGSLLLTSSQGKELHAQRHHPAKRTAQNDELPRSVIWLQVKTPIK